MTNLTLIADTISKDFRAAVDAALRSDAVQVEAILSDMNNAYQMMMDGIEKVRGMEIEAAKLIKDAMTEREKVEDEYHQRVQGMKKLLGALRGSKLSAPKLKALEGGK